MENLLLEIFDVNIEIYDLGLLEVKWNAADQKSIDVLKAKSNCLSELEIFGKRVSNNAALVQYRSIWLAHNEENTSNDKNDACLNVPIYDENIILAIFFFSSSHLTLRNISINFIII